MTGARTDPTPGPARLEALLAEQRELLGRLEALSLRQGDLIEGDDDEALLELLGERQRVVERLAASRHELTAGRASWDGVLGQFPEDQRHEIRRRLEHIAGLARSVAARDEADQRRLQGRRDRLAEELAELGRSRGALAAYGGPPAARGPGFQDTEA